MLSSIIQSVASQPNYDSDDYHNVLNIKEILPGTGGVRITYLRKSLGAAIPHQIRQIRRRRD